MRNVLLWVGSSLAMLAGIGLLLAASFLLFGYNSLPGKVITAVAVNDADGMTRIQVDAMSAEERFDLYETRYERIKELMTGAQLQISDGLWMWGDIGVGGPEEGFTAFALFPGAALDTTYYLNLHRQITVDGSTGERSDAEKVLTYFESHGWKGYISDIQADTKAEREAEAEMYGEDPDPTGRYERWQVRAVTEDGYYFTLVIESDGRHSLEVTSSPYWFGGTNRQLFDDVYDRIPFDSYHEPGVVPGGVVVYGDEGQRIGTASVPGVYTPFPKWSDPILPNPDLDW